LNNKRNNTSFSIQIIATMAILKNSGCCHNCHKFVFGRLHWKFFKKSWT